MMRNVAAAVALSIGFVILLLAVAVPLINTLGVVMFGGVTPGGS